MTSVYWNDMVAQNVKESKSKKHRKTDEEFWSEQSEKRIRSRDQHLAAFEERERELRNAHEAKMAKSKRLDIYCLECGHAYPDVEPGGCEEHGPSLRFDFTLRRC